MKPKVTVLMPVYNGDKYLQEAMGSILNQDFTDFEFLIINDGSTDDSLAIINSYKDSRIKVVSQDNQGLSAALNRGLALAQGEYIARMDADDISLPKRLTKQVQFMDSHLDVGICGGGAIIINDNGQELKRANYPLMHEEIKAEMLFGSPFAHPAVMFRKTVIEANDLKYYPDKSEDYELWIRAVKITKLANLSDFLISYRLGVGISANSHKVDYTYCFQCLLKQQLSELLTSVSETEINTHCRMADYNYTPDKQFLKLMFAWLTKLKTINQSVGLYQAETFNKVIAKQWFAVCSRVPKRSLLTWPKFWLDSFLIFQRLDFLNKIRLTKKVIINF